MLSQYIDRSVSINELIKANVAKIERRLDALSAELGKLVFETEAFDFDKNQYDTTFIRSHIEGISTIFSKHKDTHNEKVSSMQSVAKDLKAKGENLSGVQSRKKVEAAMEEAKLLESAAGTGSTMAQMMFVIMVMVTGGLAVMFLNRMRYYEKKHYF